MGARFTLAFGRGECSLLIVITWHCTHGARLRRSSSEVKTDAEESLPQRLPSPKPHAFVANIQDIACGEAHSAAVDALGTMYIWGRTKEGQCGQLGDSIETPSKMSALQHEHIKAVACGSDMTFAITASGALYQFGAIHTPSEALAHADLAGYGRSIETMTQSTKICFAPRCNPI